MLLSGCRTALPYATPGRYDRGLVIVLPGIHGRIGLTDAICHGLNDGGVDGAIEIYDWTSWRGPIYNLEAQAGNRKVAKKIAQRIVKYQKERPLRPVVLLGHSGGAALAAWASEEMPMGHNVDGVVLLAAAMSPGYDLDLALAGSRRGIVSFHCDRDWFFLGVGTFVAGTMDGRHTASAGRTGFTVPQALRRERGYDRLFQVAWRDEMAEAGHIGSHLTSGARAYVARYVAPWVRQATWDEALLRRAGDARP